VVETTDAVVVRVRRVKCRECNDTHVCLPQFLIPRRVFTAALIEAQVSAYVSTLRSLRQIASTGWEGDPPYQRLWGWVQRLGAQAGKALEHMQSILTSLDPGGELVSCLPSVPTPEGLAAWKTRTAHTRQRFLGAWRVLVTISRLAVVAAARQGVGPQAAGEYIAWANWVLGRERGPTLLSSHSAFA